ncbi:MAG: M50 family metallopeptidase [Thermoplasmata archaeon]
MWDDDDYYWRRGYAAPPRIVYLTGPYAARTGPYPGPFTSPEELRDLTVAVLVLSLIFSMSDIKFVLLAGLPAWLAGVFFLISMAAVVLCFISHEMGHKLMARRYGCWAEFRKSDTGLLIGLFLSLLGVYFAAPGAVYHRGYLTVEQTGKVSASGPAMNALVGFIFLPLGVLSKGMPVLGYLTVYVVIVSGILGIFNMLPVFIFDGRKVWAWSPAAYIGLLSALIVLLILAEYNFHFLGIL